MRVRPLLTISTTAALLLAACGGDNSPTTGPTVTDAAAETTIATTTTQSPTTTAAATTTTVDVGALARAYAEPGPFPVGVSTLQLAKGNAVEIWYPAVAGTTGQETYDVRDFTPEAIRAILTGDAPATFTIEAGRDAEASNGTFPVVLFSHGFTGIRLQSSFLTSHLASWGFIVASPDHPSRDLPNVLGGTASGDRNDSVDDLLQTLDLVIAEGASETGRLSGRVDDTNVVAVGHSAGGGTVLGAALDPRIDGYVSLASGIALGGDATTTTVEAPQLPAKPSFFMAGALDQVVPALERTQASFAAVPTPSLLWIIDGVGHNGFDDFCTFGNGTGIIGVAEASGLGGLLDAQPQLRRLGEDGCVPPAVPVTETFPLIQHAVTSWIRNLVGTDPTPVGIGPEVSGAYAVPVTIDVRP
jgi:predicted dienelactone hydrolase